MALNNVASPNLSKVQPSTDVARGLGQAGNSPGSAAGLDFRSALDQAVGGPATKTPVGGLADLARVGTPGVGATAGQLKFSAHAVERMRSRGISFAPETMKSIEGAVQKAAQKGSKDTLVLTGDSALIVSVKNNTVVTVMDKASMKENVFTNIDSTVVI